MIDGNTSSLNQHQREIDEASDAELELERANKEFSNDLFDGYFTRNYAVIDEVEELASEEGAINSLLKQLRYGYPREGFVFLSYRDFIAEVCDEIAARADDIVAVGMHRRGYGL